jgi:hypothetical protein
MRIAVYDVLSWLAADMSEDEILADTPNSNAKTSAPASASPPTVTPA